MVKKFIYFITLLVIAILLPRNVFAYVTITTDPIGTITPYTGFNITNVNSYWDGSGVYQDNNNPLMVSINNYWYGSGLYGNHLIVNADVYFGIKSLPSTDAVVNPYLNSTYDVMKATNLRCGIGANVGDGYDSTYIPEVTNFQTDYQYAYVNYSGQWLFHLTFTYKQQINPVNLNGSNMSCWFVRNPSNGFFAQSVYYLNPEFIRYYSYISNFQYSVTTDPNTALLQDIVNQNQTIINQNNTINNSINNIDNTIEDDSLPDTSNFLDDWTDLLLENNTINQILYLPVNLLTNIKSAFSGSCTNYTMPFGLTGGNETLTFRCWTIQDYLGTEVTSLISGIIGFYLIYYFALFLWKFYDDFTSMKDTLSIILENPDGPLQKGEIE